MAGCGAPGPASQLAAGLGQGVERGLAGLQLGKQPAKQHAFPPCVKEMRGD